MNPTNPYENPSGTANVGGRSPSQTEMVLRWGVVGAIVLTIVATLTYFLVNQAVSGIVKDAQQAQAMTSLLCVGSVGVLIVVALIIGSMYLMLNRTLTLAVNTEGVRAMLLSSAQNSAADADVKRAALAALRFNGYHREAAEYEPPRMAQIAATAASPRTVSVPRYSFNGEVRPLNEPPKPVTQLQTTIEGETPGMQETLTLPLIALMRFAALEGPSRQEWSGNRELYGDCARFYEAHGMLDKQANGGYKWKAEYPKQARREWLAQFDE